VTLTRNKSQVPVRKPGIRGIWGYPGVGYIRYIGYIRCAGGRGGAGGGSAGVLQAGGYAADGEQEQPFQGLAVAWFLAGAERG
jgi:hypothetical protein